MFGFLNKAADPVCKMKVDKKSEHFSDYQGSKYYFCSENCLQTFTKAPEKYVVQNVPASSCCGQSAKSCH